MVRAQQRKHLTAASDTLLQTSPVKRPRVCQIVASTNEQTGGPAGSVTNLAEALTANEVSSHLFTLDYQSLGKRTTSSEVTEHVSPAGFFARRLRGYDPAAKRKIADLAANELDLIHNHGMWMFPNLYARIAAKRANIPLVTSPRGMLDSWALNRSRIRKQAVWLLHECKNLSAVAVFHATSFEEAVAIRKLGFKQPIAVIGNGVSVASNQDGSSDYTIFEAYPELAGRKRLLFMSRLHPKKGLETLIHAWSQLSRAFSDWHLIIAGPDLTGYRAKLDQLVMSLRLEGTVLFTGPLRGSAKESILSSADLFVLPSHSENFGNVVAEALARGLPVVTTTATPWREIVAQDCGWYVDPTIDAVSEALAAAMNLSDGDRRRMGARGRALVQRKYSWERVGREMAAVYRWILSGGPKPECVEL
jgi:glycosyltransferase involved in cell wall biosynthesis